MPLSAKFVTFNPDFRILFITSSSLALDSFCSFFPMGTSIDQMKLLDHPPFVRENHHAACLNLRQLLHEHLNSGSSGITVWPQFSQMNHAGRCNIGMD